MEKIVITISDRLLARARAASRRAGLSVNAWIVRALNERVTDDELQQMLEEMREAHGATTRARRRAAERSLLPRGV